MSLDPMAITEEKKREASEGLKELNFTTVVNQWSNVCFPNRASRVRATSRRTHTVLLFILVFRVLSITIYSNNLQTSQLLSEPKMLTHTSNSTAIKLKWSQCWDCTCQYHIEAENRYRMLKDRDPVWESVANGFLAIGDQYSS